MAVSSSGTPSNTVGRMLAIVYAMEEEIIMAAGLLNFEEYMSVRDAKVLLWIPGTRPAMNPRNVPSNESVSTAEVGLLKIKFAV